MLSFSLRYRESIDAITADKATKLRKYELDDGDWAIAEDLVAILKVSLIFVLFFMHACSAINRQPPSSSPRTRRASAAVIRAMDRLTSSLNNATKRPYHPAILAAMKLASQEDEPVLFID